MHTHVSLVGYSVDVRTYSYYYTLYIMLNGYSQELMIYVYGQEGILLLYTL